MTGYELHIFILCLAVFIMLAGVLSFLITLLIRMYIRLIRNGQEDEALLKEQKKIEERKTNKKAKVYSIVEKVLSILLLVVLSCLFVFSIYVNVSDRMDNRISTIKVVKSGSMSLKRESNKYLFENDLNDQIQIFDVIRLHPTPPEEDLEVFNIVAYEINGEQIVHRIVGIEEPNAKHPDCRYFLLQGDAVASPDTFPVLYSQIKGIYYGENIPNLGGIILFMQSPAGWLCILLILVYLIGEPFINKKIKDEKTQRLLAIMTVGKPKKPKKKRSNKRKKNRKKEKYRKRKAQRAALQRIGE